MAEVTVSQLANTVGTSVDRLLAQMKQAGLDHNSSDQLVSDEDKQKLLSYLKGNHGSGDASSPRRITLKRKTLGTIKASNSQGRKTVSVEVRKKRTYVKKEESIANDIDVDNLVSIPEDSTIKDKDVDDKSLGANNKKTNPYIYFHKKIVVYSLFQIFNF